VLTYDTHHHAEEAYAVLKNPARLYNQNYRVFMNREIQVMWTEPFYDLEQALSHETRIVIIENIPINTSVRQIEEEISCFGQIERLRKYATWAVVHMLNVSEAKALVKSGCLLVDGRKWKVKPGVRVSTDPSEPDIYRDSKIQNLKEASETAYEVSVLQLSTADRQRLYEVIQSAPAFPAREVVRGLGMDLMNKAKRLLQNSRRPQDQPTEYLLTHDNKPVAPYEPIRQPSRYEPPYYPYAQPPPVPAEPSRLQQPHPIPPDQLQNMTMEQKMHYYYYLNNPQYYNPYGPPYMP